MSFQPRSNWEFDAVKLALRGMDLPALPQNLRVSRALAFFKLKFKKRIPLSAFMRKGCEG